MPASCRLALKNVRRLQSVGVVIRADGHADGQLVAERVAKAGHSAARQDRRFLFLHTVGHASNIRAHPRSASPRPTPVGRKPHAEAEARVSNRHAERPIRNHAGEVVMGAVAVDRIAERPAGKYRRTCSSPASGAEIGQSRRVGGQRADRIGRRWDIHAAEGQGSCAGRIPIKILRGGGSLR